MLGAGPSRYPATDIGLPPGSVLAFYTDGLIERPGEDISTGMARLARTLAAGPAPSLDELCDSVLASLGTDARDDIALLLARTTTTARDPRTTQSKSASTHRNQAGYDPRESRPTRRPWGRG